MESLFHILHVEQCIQWLFLRMEPFGAGERLSLANLAVENRERSDSRSRSSSLMIKVALFSAQLAMATQSL